MISYREQILRALTDSGILVRSLEAGQNKERLRKIRDRLTSDYNRDTDKSFAMVLWNEYYKNYTIEHITQ